jgi:hypothetical protein
LFFIFYYAAEVTVLAVAIARKRYLKGDYQRMVGYIAVNSSFSKLNPL